MSYESIFDKLNDISIHSNEFSNLYSLDDTEWVCAFTEADLSYTAKHYKDGTIISYGAKRYIVKDGCAVLIADYQCDTNEEEQPCHKIKKTTCDACGAHLPINNVNNNGVCKCEYCDTFHYVW